MWGQFCSKILSRNCISTVIISAIRESGIGVPVGSIYQLHLQINSGSLRLTSRIISFGSTFSFSIEDFITVSESRVIWEKIRRVDLHLGWTCFESHWSSDCISPSINELRNLKANRSEIVQRYTVVLTHPLLFPVI